MIDDIVATVLGGGRGTRLWPLTRYRSKPVLPVAGRCLLIDIAVSSGLRAGIQRVDVLTRADDRELFGHLAETYGEKCLGDARVRALPPDPSSGRRTYAGSADAVRQSLATLLDHGPRQLLVLCADLLHAMRFSLMIDQHRRSGADVTLAVQAVPRARAHEFGVVRLDAGGRVVELVEKPARGEQLDRLGAGADTVLGSLGVYLFDADVLRRLLLDAPSLHDFGSGILPAAVDRHRVETFRHDGYCEDLGTVADFHRANLELVDVDPPLDLDAEPWIHRRDRALPAARLDGCEVDRSVVCEGSELEGARVRRCVIGHRSRVAPETSLEDCVLLGDAPPDAGRSTALGSRGDGRGPSIGRGCRLRNVVVDRGAHVGDNCRLTNEAGVREAEGEHYHIRDGVVVVPALARVPPGTVI